MGGDRITAAPFIALVVVGAALWVAEATTYKVGDEAGWIIPFNSSFYSDWASKHTFFVNDILEFEFGSGSHTVAQVNKTEYENCTSSSPISKWTSGPAKVTLNATGSFYFICTIGSHCALAQKLTVDVSDSSSTPRAPATNTTSPPPSSSPPPPPTSPPPPLLSPPPPPPPSPNSASSLEAAAAATWVMFGLVYVVGLL